MEDEEDYDSLISRLTTRRARLSSDSSVPVDVKFSNSQKAPLSKSNLMCSDVDESMYPYAVDRHFLILDLDMPVELIKSSSGNNHLIVGHSLEQKAMLEILQVLAKHGIVQKKWVESAEKLGYASLRLPGIDKRNKKDNCGLNADGEIESVEEYRQAKAAAIGIDATNTEKEIW